MKGLSLLLVLRLLSLLPLGGARRLGYALGAISWRLGSVMAKVTRINIGLCYPALTPEQQMKLARESLQETFATVAEAGAIWCWPADKVLGRIRHTQGLDLLQRLYADKKGVIVIAPHIGNWEVVGLYLNTCGVGQTLQLFQAPRDARVARKLFEARSRTGAEMVATDQKGVGKLLAALRQGQLIGILPDQVPPDSGGRFATFFDVPALTMTLLPRLLQKTGARAVLGFAKRIEDEQGAGFEMIFREPDPRLYAEDAETSLRGLNASIEALVNEAPAQYQWDYKRFKRQPDGSRPY